MSERTTRRRAAAHIMTVLLASSLGCVVTESGNPPVIDTDQLRPSQALGLEIVLIGTRAVDPGGGEIFLANMTGGGIVRMPVDSDGSFRVELSYQPDDSLRLQALSEDGVLSAPYDFRTPDGSERIPLGDELSCLLVETTMDGAMVRNTCEVAQNLRARTVSGSAVTPAMFTVEAGGTTSVAFASADLDVLVLENDAGALRALTRP